jgi:hypothetical protein
MRVLAPLLAVLLAIGAAYLVYVAASPLARSRRVRLRAKARWQTRHYGERGETVVAVSLMLPTGEILDEHVVTRVPDHDADWNTRFLRATEEAAERAFHLNTTEELPPA